MQILSDKCDTFNHLPISFKIKPLSSQYSNLFLYLFSPIVFIAAVNIQQSIWDIMRVIIIITNIPLFITSINSVNSLFM